MEVGPDVAAGAEVPGVAPLGVELLVFLLLLHATRPEISAAASKRTLSLLIAVKSAVSAS